MGSPRTMGRDTKGLCQSLPLADGGVGICCGWLKASRFNRNQQGLSHVSIHINALSLSQIFLVSDILQGAI